MLTMALGVASAASCMAAAALLHQTQAGFEIHHAGKHQAVYSPRLRPAAASQASGTSGLLARSDSTAARLVTNRAGWL